MCDKCNIESAFGKCNVCNPPKPFDPTKPVKFLDEAFGKNARILCTDANMAACTAIVGLATDPANGKEFIFHRTADGVYPYSERGRDLVNVPVRREEFSNVWSNATQMHKRYITEKAARDIRELANGSSKRMGVLKYTFEDDELVSVELVK